MTIIWATEMTLVPIMGAYLRYLPFRDSMTAEERQILQRRLGWLSVGLWLYYLWRFQSHTLSLADFRVTLFMMGLLYFFISLTVLRGRKIQHLFVMGIQILWCFMLHAFAGMAVAAVCGGVTPQNLIWHTTVYLMLIFALLPAERRIFAHILPLDRLIGSTGSRLAVALMPLLIFIGLLMPTWQNVFLTGWTERLSRLSLPLLFFLFYRMMDLYNRAAAERQAQIYANQIKEWQLNTLKKEAESLEELNRQTKILRHDLRHNYGIIYALLTNGDTKSALAHIAEQEQSLK